VIRVENCNGTFCFERINLSKELSRGVARQLARQRRVGAGRCSRCHRFRIFDLTVGQTSKTFEWMLAWQI
jgi:hypothetical protein